MPIRRRAKGNTAKGSNNGKPRPADISTDTVDVLDQLVLSPEDILADSRSLSEAPQPWFRKRIFHFALGLSIGILAAFGVGSTPLAQSHISELQDFVAMYIAEMDISSKIPNSDLMDELFGNMTNYIKPAPASEQPFMPGLQVKDEFDLSPHFPVVLLPAMFKAVLFDKACWTQHLKLDPVTGLDPEGIRLRAAQGLDAADYFVTGYWVWAKIIENLAAIGYDSNMMYLASYDWRLSYHNLEVRDKFFTKLKTQIEMYKQIHGKKTVVMAHSMGSTLFPYFLKWAESPDGGKGGKSWTENHIESFANIAGPMIGVPKALAFMLSGETRDTMQFGSFGTYLLEKFFSRRERADLIRTWAGGSSMLPKGGDQVWGNLTWAPDDSVNPESTGVSYGAMITFAEAAKDLNTTSENSNFESFKTSNYTSKSSIELLYQSTSQEFNDQLRLNYSYGITTNKKQLAKNDDDHTKWANPLESQLPNAPSMKIYCMYGVGVETERSYYYGKSDGTKTVCNAGSDEQCVVTEAEKKTEDVLKDDKMLERLFRAFKRKTGDKETPMDTIYDQPSTLFIDSTVNRPEENIRTGVRFVNGDGTVPLLSLGYMSAPSGGWTKYADLYNPGRSPIIAREYVHEASDSALDVRGGAKASDHVNLLGMYKKSRYSMVQRSNSNLPLHSLQHQATGR
ncbi:Lecithin:cholesterol acyltransferase-domain-containing protein [Umbelopsis sp. AD052]|nr:Lecithin:cholesterol acyltransferase-domain-containing protein [Umbelopsis sp. AD052]